MKKILIGSIIKQKSIYLYILDLICYFFGCGHDREESLYNVNQKDISLRIYINSRGIYAEIWRKKKRTLNKNFDKKKSKIYKPKKKT